MPNSRFAANTINSRHIPMAYRSPLGAHTGSPNHSPMNDPFAGPGGHGSVVNAPGASGPGGAGPAPLGAAGSIIPDLTGIADPVATAYNALAAAGHSDRMNHPWVQYVERYLAPGMSDLHGILQGSGTSAAGFTDWVGNLLGAGIGTAGAGWMGPGQGQQALGNISGAIANAIALLPFDQQAQKTRQILTSIGAQYMNPTILNGMQAALREKEMDFARRLAGGDISDVGNFFEFIRGQGFLNVWFPGI